MAISKDLLDILICPKCEGKIRFSEEKNGIICDGCMLIYPVNNNIPVMLIDSALKLETDKK